MNNNKVKFRNNNPGNARTLERFHTLKSIGIFNSKNLYPNKLSKNFNFFLSSIPDISNNNKINKNSQKENLTQLRQKNKTVDNIHHKRKQKNQIVTDVGQIYEKIYNKLKNNNIYNITNKNIINNTISKIPPQNDKKEYKKIIMHDSHSQTHLGSFNSFDYGPKRITCNFGDFPNIQINYNHPQLYILNNNKRNNRKLNSKSILSNIVIRNQLFIKRRSDLSELIPDFMTNNDYKNRERLYEYYLRKKMEIKKFN